MNHKIKLLTIDGLDDRNGSLRYISAKINRKNVLFLIDTGATRTCINEESLEYFLSKKELKQIKEGADIMGLGTSSHKSQECIVNKIHFNRMTLHDFPLIITNLSDIFAALEAASNIKLHGIIGNDFLAEHNAVIDYKKEILRVTGDVVI
ncbi:aspartyl protease family protein [Bacteroidales bacterium OttesenSCG-928-K03]|nr:aspartyl protease family protein [Odoribacter sp. OttesenSCG-928-L07]MDL2238922.1 aspartyl protease family protein [Bacteroidales bacterium OttesenSCG-928-L14]MDL2242893.1 aspartyl protease family protein [Bacteroidales bacterium OttesenSCG-928-K03]